MGSTSMATLLVEGGKQRFHRKRLLELLADVKGPVLIASAYVTDRDLLLQAGDRETNLITALSPIDIASGATSLESLRALLEAGVQVRILPNKPRLHAKVYIFGSAAAVVTSANLTQNALDSNIEVGVELTGDEVRTLADWHTKLWTVGKPLSVDDVAFLQRSATQLRREYANFKRRTTAQLTIEGERGENQLVDEPSRTLETASRYFACNTDRVEGTRTETGGFMLEQAMYDRGYAAVWEDFRYPSHMQQVEAGDIIFMFAKGVGILGVGRATAACTILQPHDPDRIRHDNTHTPEW
jgi:hypothetical protein